MDHQHFDPYGLLSGIDMSKASDTFVGPPKEVLLITENCTSCGEYNDSATCSNCGLITDEVSTETMTMSTSSRFRIVGMQSSRFQADLFKSTSNDVRLLHERAIFAEYLRYRTIYIAQTGNAFPIDVCSKAAQMYSEICVHNIKRSENKRVIMAECLKQASFAKNYAPTDPEIACFMQLKNKGLAKGANYVRNLASEGKIQLEIKTDLDDIAAPEINTLFANLHIDGDKYNSLRIAVFELIAIADQEKIGTNSVLRTKIHGATYVVMARSPLIVNKFTSVKEFCEKLQSRIRPNTVENFILTMSKYRSRFEPCMARHGLTI